MECTIYKTVRSPVSDAVIKRIVGHILTREKIPEGSVSVHLIGDTKMKRLNTLHRGKAKTTDVLSFSAREGDFVEDTHEVGDIFISIPQIRRQAKTWEVSFLEEFRRMLVHGVLHALGYDHGKPDEATRMFSRQEKYVSELGL